MINMEAPTEIQMKVLNALASFQREKGYNPSFRELGKACGLKSSATIHFHLKNLKDMGYIEYPSYRSRTISLAGRLNPRAIPLLGTVPAGGPSPAMEENDKYIEEDP